MRRGQPCNHTFDCPANELGQGFANCSCSWNGDKQRYCNILPGDIEWVTAREKVFFLLIYMILISSKLIMRLLALIVVRLRDGNRVGLINFIMTISAHSCWLKIMFCWLMLIIWNVWRIWEVSCLYLVILLRIVEIIMGSIQWELNKSRCLL